MFSMGYELRPKIQMSINVQRDATIYSLLYFCRLLYMFRVLLLPIIRSTHTNVTTASGTGQPYLLPSATVAEPR